MLVTELYTFNLTCVIILMALYGVAIKKVWGKMFNEEYYNHAVNLLNDEYLLECYFNNYIYGKSK